MVNILNFSISWTFYQTQILIVGAFFLFFTEIIMLAINETARTMGTKGERPPRMYKNHLFGAIAPYELQTRLANQIPAFRGLGMLAIISQKLKLIGTIYSKTWLCFTIQHLATSRKQRFWDHLLCLHSMLKVALRHAQRYVDLQRNFSEYCTLQCGSFNSEHIRNWRAQKIGTSPSANDDTSGVHDSDDNETLVREQAVAGFYWHHH